nr:unnamed protein product [Callosobruchus chinensis]
MYYNDPKKPQDNISKTYYIDEVVACFKATFPKCRSESLYQSIDESMTKFKGRSALKQFMPLKPIKRGIKIWQRCDSLTGYVLKLLNDLPHAAVGTCIANRKNLPIMPNKLKNKGDYEFWCSNSGLLTAKWKDTKEVLAMSNCHQPNVVEITRKQKDGRKVNIACPELIFFYNQYMGGVDLTDQMVGMYEVDRKSQKWWRKVFYKLLLTAVVNAWTLYKEINHMKNLPLKQFMVPLAEQLIAAGKKNATIKRRKSYGRPPQSRQLLNVGEHLPAEGTSRRRCHRCHANKIEKRTKIHCIQCKIALCIDCFSKYHS